MSNEIAPALYAVARALERIADILEPVTRDKLDINERIADILSLLPIHLREKKDDGRPPDAPAG